MPSTLLRTDTRVRTLPADRFTACGLAKKLSAKALLESASFQNGRQRYSILMIREALHILQEDAGVRLRIDDQQVGFPHAARDILDVLVYFSRQHDEHRYPFPVPYGGVGFLSYEFAARCDTIHLRQKDDPLNMPLAHFVLGHVFIVCDHYNDELHVVALNYHEHEIDLQEQIERTVAKIEDLDFNYLLPDSKQYAVRWPENDGREEYMGMVQTLRDEIIAGNLLQAVPSRRVAVETDMPAFVAYTRLRRINPSPYLFYLDFDAYQLFGSSPEVHVRVRDNRVIIRPLAGTRRRGATHEEDTRLQDELLADKKERAEHLMLVDLARNDLGRVCAPASIRINLLESVEHYARVMHIVSEVEGELEPHKSAVHAVRMTFPAGTVSGAPKIRAVETVDGLEKYPRRFYAGLVAYMQSENNFDSCITIRSCLRHGRHIYLQAGSGVVYDSTPQREYEETREKLRAMVEAIGG